MSIHHRPILDTEKVEQHYSEKDGVCVTYVCTSALGDEAQAMDIFYRDSPHPDFGNRYFGLYWHRLHFELPAKLMITNADKIEEAEFGMKQHEDAWHYSQHRHDFYTVGNMSLDGGRAYFRCVSDVRSPTKWFQVRNGKFVEKEDSDEN